MSLGVSLEWHAVLMGLPTDQRGQCLGWVGLLGVKEPQNPVPTVSHGKNLRCVTAEGAGEAEGLSRSHLVCSSGAQVSLEDVSLQARAFPL